MTGRIGARLVAPLTVLGLVACGLTPEAQPRPLNTRLAPLSSLGAASPVPSAASQVLVYLTRGNSLVAVTRALAVRPAAGPALAALLQGPTGGESAAGLGTAVPASATVVGAPVAGVVAVQVVAAGTGDSGRTDEVLGYAQIVVTLTGLPGITGVQFNRDDRPLSVPRGDGAFSAGPLRRTDYLGLL